MKRWRHSRVYGISLPGGTRELVWYSAYGANMHDTAFRERRGMQPSEWRVGRLPGYRLRFNLEGKPKGKAAPANLTSDAEAEVWGVLYRITKKDLQVKACLVGVTGICGSAHKMQRVT